MKVRLVTIFSVLLFALLTFAQSPHDPLEVVSGTLRNGSGQPVSDARVELHSLRTGALVASGYTNGVGGFELANVPAGLYEIVAISGLSEVRERVNFPNAANISLVVPNAPAAATDAGGRNTVSVAQFQVPKKARELFKKAQEAARKQKHDEESKYLAQALEVYPDFADALTLRGIRKLDSNQIDDATADLEKAIQCDASYALAYLVLGAAYNRANRFDDALRSSDHGISLMPTAWQGYFENAKSYIGKADYEKALRQLDKAASLGPRDYAPIHLVKAHALLALKSYSEAMAELQAFLDHAPKGDPNMAEVMALMDSTKSFISDGRK